MLINDINIHKLKYEKNNYFNSYLFIKYKYC